MTSRPGSKDNDPLRGTGIAVKKLFCYDFNRKNYRHRSGTRIFFIELTDIAISASEIRALVKQGKSIRYLVPSAVEKYIKRRGLYDSRRSGTVMTSAEIQFLAKSSAADARLLWTERRAIWSCSKFAG